MRNHCDHCGIDSQLSCYCKECLLKTFKTWSEIVEGSMVTDLKSKIHSLEMEKSIILMAYNELKNVYERDFIKKKRGTKRA